MSKKQKKLNTLTLDIKEHFLKSIEAQVKEHGIIRNGIILMEEIGKASIEKTKGARVDMLEDISDVKLGENGGSHISVHRYYDTFVNVVNTVMEESTDHIPTLVVPVNRKYIENDCIVFRGILGYLATISNIGVVYNAVKENWFNLLMNSEGVDCVLFMPEIICFQNPDNIFVNAEGNVGFTEDGKYKLNVMLYCTTKHPRVEPEVKDSGKKSMWDDRPTRIEESELLIESILESAVRLNCTSLIVDPCCHPVLRRHPGYTIDIWDEKLSDCSKAGILREIHFVFDE